MPNLLGIFLVFTLTGFLVADEAKVPPQLLEALRSKDAAARIKAIKGLSKLGPEALAPLIEALRDEETRVQNAAAYALRLVRVEPKALVKDIKPHLGDKNAAVRRGVAGALIRGEMEGVPLLVDALRDKDSSVRRQAAVTLQAVAAKTPAAAKAALTGLDEALGDKEAKVRLAVVQALGRCGPAAAAALLKGVEDEDPNVRAYALAAILSAKAEAKTVLAAVAKRAKEDKELIVRQSALRTLGSLGEPAVKALSEALADKNPGVQMAALKSLAQLGPLAKGALAALKQAAANAEDSRIRAGATAVLGRIGPAGEPALIELLNREDSAVRLACLQQFGKKGTVSKTAVPNLILALADKDAEVRVLAAHVLGLLGADAKDAVPALTKALADKDPQVPPVIKKALGKIKAK
jgi:HEAT repeat protein